MLQLKNMNLFIKQTDNHASSHEAYSVEDRHGNGQIFDCDDGMMKQFAIC